MLLRNEGRVIEPIRTSGSAAERWYKTKGAVNTSSWSAQAGRACTCGREVCRLQGHGVRAAQPVNFLACMAAMERLHPKHPQQRCRCATHAAMCLGEGGGYLAQRCHQVQRACEAARSTSARRGSMHASVRRWQRGAGGSVEGAGATRNRHPTDTRAQGAHSFSN